MHLLTIRALIGSIAVLSVQHLRKASEELSEDRLSLSRASASSATTTVATSRGVLGRLNVSSDGVIAVVSVDIFDVILQVV